ESQKRERVHAQPDYQCTQPRARLSRLCAEEQMTSTCPQCSMSLSLDDTRLPTEPFSVVCPRCRNTVTITPPPKEEERLPNAPREGQDQTELLRGLAAVLSGSGLHSGLPSSDIDKWQRRRIVMCLEEHRLRDQLRAAVDPARYELFVADLSQEAIEIMH